MNDTSLKNSNSYHHKQQPDNDSNQFTDKTFPPNDNSILFIDSTKSVSSCIEVDDTKPLKGLIWHRPTQIFKDAKFKIFDKMDLEDIHQGVLGNCYFLSSLSAIAENHERLAKLVLNKEVPKNGCYAIKVYIQGKEKTVVIDDLFPVFKNRNFAMAYSGPGEIWVQLFEKLWAKLNLSYTMTIAGLPSEALSTLTEAPVITYIHKKYEPSELCDILKKCDDENYIICTTTSGNAGREVGLVSSHAYTVISVYDFDDNKLLKIRNPWGGGFEWNGDFGDKSNKWTKEIKQKVNFQDADDGIFYMTFQDFLKYFPYTFVCKYYDGWSYKYKKIIQTNSDRMIALKFKVDKKTKAIIGLHQKQERFYNKVKNYKPVYCKLFLIKYHNHNYEYICSNEGSIDKIYLDLEETLEPGDYYVFARVNWTYFNQDTCSVIFSMYTDNNDADLLPVDRQFIKPDYITKIFDSFIAKKCTYKDISDKKDGLKYVISLNDTDTGFFWLSFKNMNPNETCKISFACQYNNNVTLLSKNINIQKLNGKDIYNICVPPNSSELVVFEQLDNVWLCKISLSPLEIEWDGGMYNPDFDKNFIVQNSDKLVNKEYIVGNEVYYGTMIKENAAFIIIQNDSPNDYMIRVSLTNMVNCSIVYPLYITSTNLRVHSKSFEFIKLVSMTQDKIDFNFVYSYKNLSRDLNESSVDIKTPTHSVDK